MSGPAIHLLLSACPDPASAERIALALVEERLAACVTRLPGARSTYRWNGAIEHADEVQLIAKTTSLRLDAAIARIRELHPYELPEIVAVQTNAGLPGWLDWVHRETSEET
jgi:periplasmic divalent cation tolerance protein